MRHLGAPKGENDVLDQGDCGTREKWSDFKIHHFEGRANWTRGMDCSFIEESLQIFVVYHSKILQTI